MGRRPPTRTPRCNCPSERLRAGCRSRGQPAVDRGVQDPLPQVDDAPIEHRIGEPAAGGGHLGRPGAGDLDELVSLLVAGHETTAVALSWAWQLLGAHPDVEERMAHELRVVLGDGPIDPARHASLRYTRCVVHETLRLYPPAWVVPRLAVRPVELDGHRIPPGDVVIVCTHLLHRDPRFWDEPGRFDPTRFEDGAAGARRHPAYLPFGAGPRSCLGREFALMEATLLLAALARRFRAVPLAPAPVPATFGFTLRPAEAVPMRLAGRSPSRV